MTAPARLLIARHGETDWNREGRWQGDRDIPINATGRVQAEALAARLKNEGIAAIHSSDLSRASETAAIVGAQLGITPRNEAYWRELRLGSLTGRSNATISNVHGELVTAIACSDGPLADGVEEFHEIQARLREGFRRVCDEHAGRTVLVVGHGGTLKALIADLIGLPPQHIHHLSLRGNTSLSEIDFRHGRPQLVRINCTAHLEQA
jgi:broad specificity phosphatase PhoE